MIVVANQSIAFKDSSQIAMSLDAALKKEQEKYGKCPITRDLFPEYEMAQGWGYVVAGYFLVEESFKALAYVRGKEQVPPKHSLSKLFGLLGNDQATLREFYSDYRATIGGNRGEFPLETLDDFLANLDGDENRRGDHVGSFDWRYFLIEEGRTQPMPFVSVDYLHEIVYGSVRIIEFANNDHFEPSRYTHSWRIRWERKRKYSDWLDVRVNSDGWDGLGDRLEILWGPDYRGRYDLYLFRGKGLNGYFCEIPDNLKLPVIDMRKEIETFDPEEGFRSIGMTRISRP